MNEKMSETRHPTTWASAMGTTMSPSHNAAPPQEVWENRPVFVPVEDQYVRRSGHLLQEIKLLREARRIFGTIVV
jgi:hypothetical protein